MRAIRSGLTHFAKLIYDNYPALVKNLGLLEIAGFPPYRALYQKQIDRKMVGFLKGAITVEFEVTNKCNADCIMCPNGVMERPIERMEMPLFIQIVDEFARANPPLLKFVFAGLGEPTLDQQLPEKIRYLKAKFPHVPVQITTNASLLTLNRSKELIAAGLDQLIISFNGTTKESYENVMGRLNYDKTLGNILQLLPLRVAGRPQLTISCVRLDANAADFNGMEKFWNEKGVQVDRLKTPVPFNRGGEQMLSRYKSKWALPNPTKPRHLLPCRMMAENLLIHPNGSVVLCFVDYEEKIVMGQFGKNTLQEIMQTKANWFENQKQGDFSQTPLCKNCSFMREQVVAWWQDEYF